MWATVGRDEEVGMCPFLAERLAFDADKQAALDCGMDA